MNMAKEIMAQEQLFVGFLAAVTLGTVGFNWYAKYFKAHYEGESTWNAYQTPRIDYDRTEQK